MKYFVAVALVVAILAYNCNAVDLSPELNLPSEENALLTKLVSTFKIHLTNIENGLKSANLKEAAEFVSISITQLDGKLSEAMDNAKLKIGSTLQEQDAQKKRTLLDNLLKAIQDLLDKIIAYLEELEKTASNGDAAAVRTAINSLKELKPKNKIKISDNGKGKYRGFHVRDSEKHVVLGQGS